MRTAESVLVVLARETGESCPPWVRRGVRRLCVLSIEAVQEVEAVLDRLDVSALLCRATEAVARQNEA